MTTPTPEETTLARLGGAFLRLRHELDELRPAVAKAIREAHDAGVSQVRIIELTGYSRDQIRVICLLDRVR